MENMTMKVINHSHNVLVCAKEHSPFSSDDIRVANSWGYGPGLTGDKIEPDDKMSDDAVNDLQLCELVKRKRSD